MRIEPPPSEPSAPATMPAATAAALPPLDPPVLRCGSHGLRVAPHVCDSVSCGHSASSGMFVLPTMIAPAARRRRTTSQSARGGLVDHAGAVRRQLAGDVHVVLDRDRHAEQRRASPAAQPRLRGVGLGERAFGAHHAEGVDGGSRRSMRSRLSSTSSRARAAPERTSSACAGDARVGEVGGVVSLVMDAP